MVSTKQRSITSVVRSFRHSGRGKVKNDSNFGKPLQLLHHHQVDPLNLKATKSRLRLPRVPFRAFFGRFRLLLER